MYDAYLFAFLLAKLATSGLYPLFCSSVAPSLEPPWRDGKK